MYGAVSREHRRITTLVCDTARITNGITARITACVTRRIAEYGAIGLDARTRGFQSYVTHPLRDESVIRGHQRPTRQHLPAVSNR